MNILIIRFSALGDLVTQEVAFRAVRHFYPHVHITFLTSSIGKALYEDSPYFDEYIVFKKEYLKTNAALRKKHYDIIFNVQCNRLSHLLLLGVPHGRIFNQSETWWQKFLGLKAKPTWMPEMLKCSGIDEKRMQDYYAIAENLTIILPYKHVDFEWAKGNQAPIIALAVGASERWSSKKWGDEKFNLLTKRLIECHYIVVLIGSSLESEAGAFIERHNPSVINLIAKTTLSELKSVLAKTDLLIGNDSGPAHLSAGIGKNTLTIFGSTDIKHCVKFGNYRGTHDFLVSALSLKCQPCYKSTCPTKHECMESISVDTVMKKAQELLCSKH
jgi:heptosyltransferase-1